MLKEQSPKLALSQAKPFRQRFDACSLAIESAIGNKSQRPRDRIRSSTPRRQVGSSLGPATQAWPKTCLLCRSRRTEKEAVLEPRGTRRADRSAIDARRGDAHKYQAVKTRIPTLQSAITYLSVGQFHRRILSPVNATNSRFSDMVTNGESDANLTTTRARTSGNSTGPPNSINWHIFRSP